MNPTNEHSLEQSEERAISELIDLDIEMAEAVLSAITSGEVLEKIPVVKGIRALYDVVACVRDKLLLRKLEIFINRIADIPRDKRVQMVNKLRSDQTYGEHIGEHIIEIIDKIDGRRKPAMMGAIFAALANNEIDVKMFNRLSAAIKGLPPFDIDTVRRMGFDLYQPAQTIRDGKEDIEHESLQAITNAGLAATESTYRGLSYRINQIGAMFVKLNLDRFNDSGEPSRQ
jgi:hypothetical protein